MKTDFLGEGGLEFLLSACNMSLTDSAPSVQCPIRSLDFLFHFDAPRASMVLLAQTRNIFYTLLRGKSLYLNIGERVIKCETYPAHESELG